MLNQLIVGGLVIASLSSPAAARWQWVPDKLECVVADPTNTPLNVRSSPNGRIIGALHNDTQVVVTERVRANGEKWARVLPEVGKQGWVYWPFLSCD